MATAISRIYTPEGFVVASDSRESNTLKPDQATDDVQKIFPVLTPGVHLSYGIAGTARLTDADGVAFNFITTCVNASEAAAENGSRTWPEYVAAFTRAIARPLDEVRRSSTREISNSAETHIFLTGFYRRQPRCARILFQHGLRKSKSEYIVERTERLMLYGSDKVWSLLFNEDPRFKSFLTVPRSSAITLLGAIERARNEILAHYDPVARELDEEKWRAVGGRFT